MKKAKAIQQVVAVVNAGFQGDSTEENAGLNEYIPDESINLPEDMLVNNEELTKAVELLSEINPREAEVLSLRFGLDGKEPLTLKQIGQKLRL